MPELVGSWAGHWEAAAIAALLVTQLLLLGTVIRLRSAVARNRRRLAHLAPEVSALCSAGTGMGERLVRAEELLRRLTERHDQLELRAGGERQYAQAIRMVQNGAGIEDLVTSCGLTHGEAELVVMLHGVAETG